MTNPWLITIGPMVIPHEARAELHAMQRNRSPEAYAREIWKLRAQAAGPAKRSNAKYWAARRELARVRVLPLKRRGQK